MHVISDWEGPWDLADHAFETSRYCILNGDSLFSRISEFDDYLSYVKKKQGYEPGDTLALMAPFFISFGVDENDLLIVARKCARLLDGSMEALDILSGSHDLDIVSTSYNQYLDYICPLTGVKNYHCTHFPLDILSLQATEDEKARVREYARDIAYNRSLGISAYTKPGDVNPEKKEVLEDMEGFFFEYLPDTGFAEVFEKVAPMGGQRKLEIAKMAIEKNGHEIADSAAVADSITDYKMLDAFREAGGAAISFNGNEYAILNSNIAMVSPNSMLTTAVIELFNKGGLDAVEKISGTFSHEKLRKAFAHYDIDRRLYENIVQYIENTRSEKPNFPLPEIFIAEKSNHNEIMEKSMRMRALMRGKAGYLG